MTPPPDRPAATPSRERVSALLDAYAEKLCDFASSRVTLTQVHVARAALDAALASLADDAARMDYADAYLCGGDLLEDPPMLYIALPRTVVFNSSDSARAILDAARSPIGETPEDQT